MIGRVSCIAIDPGRDAHLLGSAGGGIWESKNSGTTWPPCTDTMPSLAIGALTFDPSNANRVYAGSGEGNFYANLGAGIYRSTDGGTTWTVLASSPFIGVGFYDLVVDPQLPRRSMRRQPTDSTSPPIAARPGPRSAPENAGISACIQTEAPPSARSFQGWAACLDQRRQRVHRRHIALAPADPWSRLAVDRVTASPDVTYVFGAAGTSPSVAPQRHRLEKITVPATLSVNQAWYDWYVAATPDKRNQVYIGAIDTLRGDLSGSAWTWTNITSQGTTAYTPTSTALPSRRAIPRPSMLETMAESTGRPIAEDMEITQQRTRHHRNRVHGERSHDVEMADGGNPGQRDYPLHRGTKWDHIADGDGGDCGVDQQTPISFFTATTTSRWNGPTTRAIPGPAAPPNVLRCFIRRSRLSA